ncbi:MAG: glycosyltransferase [Oscillospiraceae bacterium]|nr:glycosyltransferase [Oscillospiraceae bacterium]
MKKQAKIWYASVLSAAAALYLGWRIFATIPYDHGVLSVILALILLFVEVIGCIELISFVWFYAAEQPESAVKPKKNARPDAVDVMVTTCGEPTELLRRTLSGCLTMRYEGKKTIWLLDDAGRMEMKELAEEMGVRYLCRNNRENAKAGNLNAAIAKTKAPLIAVFDADMAPKPDFLEKTVPLMHSGVGFVQTPQSFINPDLFQKACEGMTIPNEQDFFYHSIEPSRNAVNAVVLAGSNMLISRRALTSTHGFVTGTLTEDFATGIAIEKQGYKGIAITDVLAEGEAPESLGSLIRQRVRWASGCIQSGRQAHLLFGKGLTFRQRLSYLMAVSYWYFPVKRLIYLLAPLLYSFFGIAVMRCDVRSAAIWWLPMFGLTVIGIPLLSKRTRTLGWSMFYETCLTPFLLVPVLRESLGIHKKTFHVTDKSGKSDWQWWMALPHGIASAVLLTALIMSVRLSLQEGSWQYVMLVFWNLYHFDLALAGEIFVLCCRYSAAETEKRSCTHCLDKRAMFALKLPCLLTALRNKERGVKG